MFGSGIEKSTRHNQAVLGEHFSSGDNACPEPKASVCQNGVIAGPQHRKVLADTICKFKGKYAIIPSVLIKYKKFVLMLYITMDFPLFN